MESVMNSTHAGVDKLIAETAFPSAAVTQCPYPHYEAFLEAPVYQLPTGEFVVSRHDDVFHVTRHPEIFSSHISVFEDGWSRTATLEDHANREYPWGIVSSDAPEHTWKRKLAFEMFKPGRLRGRESVIEGFVDELIDGFIDRGECAFVEEFCDPLPGKIILTLFGLPLEHLERALTWSRYEGFGTRYAAMPLQQAARDGIVDLGGFVRDEITKRADNPGDDDMSLHVQRHIEARGKLDMPNLIAEVSNLFIGGIITTTHLLGTMMKLFIENPDQQETARAGRSQLKRAIEESLRIESPVQIGGRLVVQDTEIGEVKIPAGSLVLVCWGAANRDESVFECPEKFDVERPNANNHMGFGNGPHFCMGAPLARLEAMIAFERIFARMGNIQFAEGSKSENHWAVIFRGPSKLDITFDKIG
jgi:cytochrome P450